MKSTQYAVHKFFDLENAPFSIKEYSRLKFGCNKSAKKFGYALADSFAACHLPTIIGQKLLIIPSPYNYVKNAATIMTEHFINRLNHISVEENGNPVEASLIHRRCSYFQDYGHLSKNDRKGLLDGDEFYINEDFLKDKVLVFIDDVIITGTHEDKIKEILFKKNIKNETFFLYYAHYHGENPEIEAAINFADIKSIEDYLKFSQDCNPQLIVRPLKYILSQSLGDLNHFLKSINPSTISQIYYGCLAEGYFKLPKFQENFNLIKHFYER